MFKILGQNCRFLLKLDLYNNYILDGAVKALSEAEFKYLQDICLKRNFITAEGVKYLANC